MLALLRKTIVHLALALMATATSLTAQTSPDQLPFAESLKPIITLRWDPETRAANLAFSGGCMSSSVKILGNTLTARLTLSVSEIVLDGAFWVDDRAVMRLMDLNNCPRKEIILPDLPYGTYTVRYARAEPQVVDLTQDRIDLTVSLNPRLTPRHIKNFHRDGAAPFLTPLRANMSSETLKLFGPAVILPRPDSLLTHVAPDPTIWWFSQVRMLSIGLGLRCLSAHHLYMGNTTWAELNRTTRTITMHGDLRFLPWPSRHEASDCLDLDPGRFGFSDVEPGTYRVMQDGQELFTVTLGEADLGAHRFGVFPMR
jgi:hypothetical protein